MAQIPGSDNALITPIQVTMVISLAKIFGKPLAESAARATLATASSAMVGRAISQVLIGWIPGIGNVINATTAAGITEVVGWVLADEFAQEAAY